MNPLEGFVTGYLMQNAPVYFARQLAVIVCIFVFGALLADALLSKDEKWARRCLVAFPAGLSAFAITGYAMLVLGIPYSRLTVCIAVALEAAAAIFVSYRRGVIFAQRAKIIHMLIALGAAVLLGAVATSGIAPVSVSNDTMYYFKRYPDSIVHYGMLRDQFDFFLTDTGLGAVVIDTLPPLFGFGESFGIREMFHLNFILFFGVCVYERAKEHAGVRGGVIAAVLISGVLTVSTPFFILGHWALANMYFMEMFFIAAYSAADYTDKGRGVTPLLLLALSFFRIEGTLFVVWLVICIAYYTGIGRKLAVSVMLPMAVMFGGYSVKIFTQFYVLDNIYTFLRPEKAAVLVGVIVIAGVYIMFIEPRIPEKFAGYLPVAYIGALALGNVLLFVMNRELYIGNLKAFYANLFRQSGWGMMPYFVIAMTLLLAAEYVIRRVRKEKSEVKAYDPFTMTLAVGFVLIVLAASYGRGDVLSEVVGDSGNRVLLQIVPVVTLLYGEMFVRMFDRS